MRENVKLVLVGIPGINEDGPSLKYRNYVANNWKLFDCVILVLDGRQDINREDQTKLLHFIRENQDTRRQLLIIIVCNRNDDQEEMIVNETRKTVENIFKASHRGLALQKL